MPAGPLSLRDALLGWFRDAKRDLPWRRTRDPYAIWVSEVMLQQTRVETVIPYWTRFLTDFPTVRALAEASESDVLARWSGLGYYRRARLLHAGARAVIERHGDALPADHAALRALPGVGDYTAGAVGSIAFDLPVPLVDGNVERVLTRLHAIPGDPRRGEAKRRVWDAARDLAQGPDPGDLNQSLMELGATVCTPTGPRCLTCPVRAWCAAARQGDPTRYPQKPARPTVPTERWRALVATRGEGVWLLPSASGRWHGMMVPPMVRAPTIPRWPADLEGARDVGVVVHVLTHARMEISVTAGSLSNDPPEGELVRLDALDGRAVPKLTRVVLAAALDQRASASRKKRPV